MTRKVLTPTPPDEPLPPVSLQQALMWGAQGLKAILSGQLAAQTFDPARLPQAINLLWSASLFLQFAESRKEGER